MHFNKYLANGVGNRSLCIYLLVTILLLYLKCYDRFIITNHSNIWYYKPSNWSFKSTNNLIVCQQCQGICMTFYYLFWCYSWCFMIYFKCTYILWTASSSLFIMRGASDLCINTFIFFNVVISCNKSSLNSYDLCIYFLHYL